MCRQKELYERGVIKMDNCNYKYNLPGVGKCCHKYYETEREDGKIWTHFPLCEEENCPIIHPELLSAAKKKGDKVCLWCCGKLKMIMKVSVVFIVLVCGTEKVIDFLDSL